MTNDLIVRPSMLQPAMIGGLAVFLLPMAIYLLYSGVSSGIKPAPVGLGIAVLLIIGTTVGLYLKGRGRSVSSFSASGLKTNNGREFVWTDLKRVVDKMANKSPTRKALWRTELQFSDGSAAWIIPSKVTNYNEVRQYVNALNCERVKEDA